MKTIAVFASGNGSNFEALAASCADGRIAARIALMVCDKPGAFVNERAARYGIKVIPLILRLLLHLPFHILLILHHPHELYLLPPHRRPRPLHNQKKYFFLS